ncbi:flagellar assembly peptidoglycan hydrolase FlgJ [Alteromonas sp. ASW11-130]|uniref:flagellar assembly peptidoglycan hydrolase FlgJ n=1 Tax=Alteromonas sp. ASW11-130 TaxID=3015775 RepID=UPI0022418B82|nr:flagellar assembly peptidoglycan hydrolase FlgJ [Alteromonas sp. ASW11-130]MCW8091808.1 flagellar assembly peptidoglycan hydrolase FlgJ [Alteromonas sp. ASW11-130]
MNMNSAHSKLDMARNVHDLGSVNKLREAIASGDEEVLEEAAQQFEAIFVQMMFKSMRKAQEAIADENSPFNSQQVKFYQEMHDQQLAADLSAGGGLGLADLIVQQLGQQDKDFTPASVIRDDGNITSLNQSQRAQVKITQEKVLESNSMGAASSFKAPMFDDQESFIQALYPHAREAAELLGTDPKAIIAQAAVETGWGKFIIHDAKGNSSHNLFGIKANRSWEGKQAIVDTLEFEGGVAKKHKAAFRAYESIKEAVHDYVDFIRSQPRYQQAVENGADTQSYFSELQRAGYATDPNYADKIMAVFKSDIINGFMP